MSVSALLRRPRNQTPEHYALTLIGYGWLWTHGCRVIGFEVPVAGWIFDVVGVKWPKRSRDTRPQVYVVEAKGHRSDFRQEVARKARVEGAAARVRAAKEALAAVVGDDDETGRYRRYHVLNAVGLAKMLRQPVDLAALGGEMGREVTQAEVDAVIELDRAERIVRRHQRVERLPEGGYGEVPRVGKLWCEKVLAETSARYVIAPDGVVIDGELPPGWGLLSPRPKIVTRCDPGPTPEGRVAKVIEHLATTFTYRVKDGLPGATGASNVSLPTFEDLVAACRDEQAGPAAGPEHGEDDDGEQE